MNYLQKRRRAFKAAFIGVARLFTREAHAKIHLFAALCVIACAIIFKVSRWEWCALILCIGGVFMAEAINTAVEKLADRITREQDPLIGAAKDVAAAAVLLFAFATVAVGLIVFIPHWI